ncbi:Ribosomal protein S18 acetylase RimI [Streptoalloteichus tenebrarius]|uniref:Ribosomal protein S18 acetylase RimI n=1 Tax=Streptoalloteichus tenebrarius (strain ATCC 17920 / DSM 40477 / JCM 4838 / CBS 697.72 / NBRC 16177 / NCIMB 11028 / NRRL B-12390 / A12253. 1 / ISP 5477) TaxID=1933 RepID=A0ABT1HN25_STRSD|nr:GNAT family N-acetyltransferase [Streptoalloteichus tenebrarius]MCP2256916.1 Ribosomal protein S18 acetylase RimI [Streptoalloteichus tenebrarius]BFF00176.1 GNAT family N-acetyltransferase [Streptoalloteichus tenebrarius]
MAIAAVRPAEPADVPEITRVQLATWRTAYAGLLPDEVLSGLDAAGAERAWLHAVTHGPALVFVATEGDWTVGFCAAGPAPEDEVAGADGALPADAATTVLVSALLVEPRWGRRGHGGRLLAAAAHALRDRGATRGVVWVPEADSASLGFYRSVGWEPDGTVRTLDAGGRTLRELRLSGSLELTLRA